MRRLLYKILDRARFEQRDQEGRLPPAPIDLKDGFVHLSDAAQVRETARLHFGAVTAELVLVALRAEALPGLRFEPSRGGQLFPHVYGDVPLAAIAFHHPLPRVDGAFVFPETPDSE